MSRLATITVSIVLACEPNAPLAHETRLAATRQPRPAQHVTSRTNRRTCARALGSRAVGDGGVLSIANCEGNVRNGHLFAHLFINVIYGFMSQMHAERSNLVENGRSPRRAIELFWIHTETVRICMSIRVKSPPAPTPGRSERARSSQQARRPGQYMYTTGRSQIASWPMAGPITHS